MALPVTIPPEDYIRPRESTTKYFSETNINLTQVPEVIEAEDPVLYRELLDIHDAIEALTLQFDRSEEDATEIENRNLRITNITENYSLKTSDGTIRVDATAGDILVLLHSLSQGAGQEYNIKRIDDSYQNTVIFKGQGAEAIDGKLDGIRVSTRSSYHIKNSTEQWDIL